MSTVNESSEKGEPTVLIKQALLSIVAFLLLVQPTVGFSTQRRLETLIYQEEEYSINACILEEYWGASGKRPKMRILNSYVDEYEVTWKIEGEELYLSQFNATSAEPNASTMSIEELFPDKERVKATWFTGTVLMLKGKDSTGSFDHVYPEILCLLVERGNVFRIESYSNFKFSPPGKIGVQLQVSEGRFYVKGLSPNGPAALGNELQVEVEIVFVRSKDWGVKSLFKLSVSEAFGYLEGIDETQLTLGIKRGKSEEITEINLERKSHFSNRNKGQVDKKGQQRTRP